MKMFGFFNQKQGANSQGANSRGANSRGANSQGANSQGKQLSTFSQFNLASIMRMQSTGCTSCRG